MSLFQKLEKKKSISSILKNLENYDRISGFIVSLEITPALTISHSLAGGVDVWLGRKVLSRPIPMVAVSVRVEGFVFGFSKRSIPRIVPNHDYTVLVFFLSVLLSVDFLVSS